LVVECLARKMGSREWKTWAPTNSVLRKMREEVRDRGRDILLSLLEENPRASLLDLGCSIGDLTLEMAKRVGTSEVFGVDKISYANSYILVHEADLNEGIPFGDNQFDVVVASQLIEHLQRPKVLISETYRVLKPGGYALISTPNLASWHNLVFLFFGLQPPGLSTNHDYIFLLTTKGLLSLLEKFKIEQVIGVGFYPLPYLLSKYICKVDKRHSVDIVVKVRKV